MRAAVCPSYGPPEVLEVRDDVTEPVLGPGQVRVRIEAASVNFPDVLLVAGEYQVKVPPPFVPGSEFAGVVEEVADDVVEPVVGDRVMGTALVGAFAEQVVVGASALTRVPDGVTAGVAAAFGVASRTAYHVLRSVAGATSEEEVVVLGAGGGVGLSAVQVAHALGCRVTAVADSDEKLEVAGDRGADLLVDTRAGDLREALRKALPDGADVVVDLVGGALSEPALRSMRYGGRFVTVGYASGDIPQIPLNLVLLKGVTIHGFQFRTFAEHHPEDLRRNEAELLELLRDGRVAPHVGATFSLDEAVAALRYVADGKAVGKVVLEVSQQR